MKKIKVFIGLLMIATLSSCSAVPSRSEDLSSFSGGQIDIHQFDIIKIGLSNVDVKKITGEPSEVQKDSQTIDWFFNDHNKNGFQRATVTFDISTGLVKSVLVIPRETDRESHLDYLQKEKFMASDFVKAPLLRCKRDYFPPDVFYISPSTGVVIKFDLNKNAVRTYSRNTISFATELIDKIKNCER